MMSSGPDGGDRGDRGKGGGDWEEDEIKDQPRLINTCFA